MALRLAVDGEASQAGDGQAQAMPPEVEFRVGVAHEHGGVRIRPVGEIDLATIGFLRERTSEAMAIGGVDRIVLDLRAATFLDSSGLHLALDIDRWATSNGVEFGIIAGPPDVQHAFDASGLSARLPFVDPARHPSHTSGSERPGDEPRREQSVRPRA
jgi:anti-anti-sigma factor